MRDQRKDADRAVLAWTVVLVWGVFCLGIIIGSTVVALLR